MRSKKKVVQKHRDAIKHHKRVLNLLEQLELGQVYKFRVKTWSYDYSTRAYGIVYITDIGKVRTFNDTGVRYQLVASDMRTLKTNTRFEKKHPDYTTVNFKGIVSVTPMTNEELLEEVPLYAGGEGFPLMKELLETGRL